MGDPGDAGRDRIPPLALTWMVHDGMAWRACVFAMPPFALLALSFGWIFHARKDRALVWVRTIWGLVLPATVLVTSCSGK